MAKAATKDDDKKQEIKAADKGGDVISAEEQAYLRETQGEGLEGVRMEDQVLPRVKIVQKLTPENDDTNSEFIDGIKPGDFLNAATKKVSQTLIIIPAIYKIEFVEWKPNRGGLFKNWGADDSMYRKSRWVEDGEKKFMKTPNGNIMQPTGTFFCLEVSEDIPEHVVISLASTQYKHSQEFVSRLMNEKVRLDDGSIIRPAAFYRSYTAETQLEVKGKNNWYGWRIRPAVKTTDLPNGFVIRDLARQLAQAVKAGSITAEVEEENLDKDIPF